MEEIYWITRLDSVVTALTALIAFLTIAFIIGAINYHVEKEFDPGLLWRSSLCFGNEEKAREEEEANRRKMEYWKKFVWRTGISLLVVSVIAVFVPRTKTMMMIYGIGGIVDYAKQSDELKELPDKCVKAIDMFVDKYMDEDDNHKND